MKQIDILENIRIASPCHESWERMVGDERVRHCDSCQLNVYSFSEMTPAEIASLVLKTEGRVCGRIYRRADGTMLTRDCPVGLRAVRLRVAKFAGAVFATLLSMCSISFAQGKGDDKQSTRTSSYKIETVPQGTNARLTGEILDLMGAVITRAEVTLKRSGSADRKVVSDEYGAFAFTDLNDGDYSLSVTAPGFLDLNISKISIQGNKAYRVNVTLDVGEITMGGPIIGYPIDDKEPKRLRIKN